MKKWRLLFIVTIGFLLISGCRFTGEVTADSGNIIPFGSIVSANTTYHNVFYVEPNASFSLQVLDKSRADINGVDSIKFESNHGSGVFEFVVEFTIGDLAPGDTISIKYQFAHITYTVN